MRVTGFEPVTFGTGIRRATVAPHSHRHGGNRTLDLLRVKQMS